MQKTTNLIKIFSFLKTIFKKTITHRKAIIFCFLLLLFLNSCSYKKKLPEVALAIEGPPLAIEGDLENLPMEGEMDRTCMAGVGKIVIKSKKKDHQIVCRATLDSEPSIKGRVYGRLECSDNTSMILALRNIGPDQGVGFARSMDASKTMILFYHPSREEALRRLPSTKKDIQKALSELHVKK